MKLKKHLFLGRKAQTNLDSKRQRHYFANKDSYSESYGFSSSHVWIWELGHEERWALKNWCFWTGLLEKTLESPMDFKEIKPVHPKGNQFWIFIGRTDPQAETPILWPLDVKSQLIRKDPDAGGDWKQEEKGTTEDEMVGWHHRLNAHEFEQAPEDGEGQGSLACCSSWSCKESDTAEQLNTKNKAEPQAWEEKKEWKSFVAVIQSLSHYVKFHGYVWQKYLLPQRPCCSERDGIENMVEEG